MVRECAVSTHAADEGRDEGDASLSAGDGLSETKEEGEVAADQVSQACLRRKSEIIARLEMGKCQRRHGLCAKRNAAHWMPSFSRARAAWIPSQVEPI